MEYIYPDYYKEFTCIGGGCKDNCCAAGWQIAIDEESLLMYQKMEGEIGVRVRNCIDWKNGMFELYDHKCALLNEKGLCDIYCDAGEDKMCVLCQRFPRHFEEYENVREISLSVACEEAARIILTKKDKASFYIEETDEEEEYEDFDYLMYTKLVEIRDVLYDIAQNRNVPFKYRMCKLLKITHDIQNKIYGDEIFEIDDIIDAYWNEFGKNHENTEADNKLKKSFAGFLHKMPQRRQYMKEMMSKLHNLEVLNSSWKEFLKECEELLYEKLTDEEYEKFAGEFEQKYSSYELENEQLLVYFIFTYFCGSVYDYESESKVKFGMVALLLIRELDMAVFYKNGGKLSLKEQIEIVHNYSKEIEHSDLNLDDLEKMVISDKVFGYRRMLTVCMN